jgi:ATP-dependent protease ClpP protease subunit
MPNQRPSKTRPPDAAPTAARLRRAGLLLAAACLALAACRAPEPPATTAAATEAAKTSASAAEEGGAISAPAPKVVPAATDVLKGSDWPPATLASGTASVGCETDYAGTGDGEPLADLGFFAVADAIRPCRDGGVLRLRYSGKISADFADLVERVSAMADRMEIGKRILDIDSAGGQVEDGIRAGDAIGDAHWTIWVRDGSVCHSACVFILAAGDNRIVSGDVGIHRIIRLHSDATTRAELEAELRAVHDRIKDYFARNGVDVAVADMMMTVPSSQLRLLTPDELRQYGLAGSNPVQEDLERIRLARKCGESFVHRREAFLRAFDAKCAAGNGDVDAVGECGRKLRRSYGFPDRRCPTETPMAEYD